jgi:hypothetical protein
MMFPPLATSATNRAFGASAALWTAVESGAPMLRGATFSAANAAEHVRKSAATSADGTTRRIAKPEIILPLHFIA